MGYLWSSCDFLLFSQMNNSEHFCQEPGKSELTLAALVINRLFCILDSLSLCMIQQFH